MDLKSFNLVQMDKAGIVKEYWWPERQAAYSFIHIHNI
jgi:hypothetical protein